MDPNVKDKILSRARAREWQGWTPPDPTLKQVRQKFGGPGVSDEELVLRVIAGESAVNAMLRAGPPKEYLDARQPLIGLLGELAKRSDYRQIQVQKGSFTLSLERK